MPEAKNSGQVAIYIYSGDNNISTKVATELVSQGFNCGIGDSCDWTGNHCIAIPGFAHRPLAEPVRTATRHIVTKPLPIVVVPTLGDLIVVELDTQFVDTFAI